MNELDTTFDQPRSQDLEAARSSRGQVRWFQHRKAILRDRARTVAATLLVLLIGLCVWWYYSPCRGRLLRMPSR